MNIFAEVTIDETGIIKQIDAVKEAADRFEDEALKLRGMLAQAKATAKVRHSRKAGGRDAETERTTSAGNHIKHYQQRRC